MTSPNMEQARFNMAEQQIRPWDVGDTRVLDILQTVPRENFVPHAYKGLAFADTEIPIGESQHMMAPKIEARMLQALAIRPSDQILEIGTGSGFVTACLAKLGNHVMSYEIHESLTLQAREKLALAGISNVSLHTANPLSDKPSATTFDVIAVTGSLPEYDDSLQQLLSPGGRMFVVVGKPPVMHTLLITRDTDDQFQQTVLFETDLQALEGVPEGNKFVF
jgi:protein-L-isoaspartate(D-aspartate) O-methyltransferase